MRCKTCHYEQQLRIFTFLHIDLVIHNKVQVFHTENLSKSGILKKKKKTVQRSTHANCPECEVI